MKGQSVLLILFFIFCFNVKGMLGMIGLQQQKNQLVQDSQVASDQIVAYLNHQTIHGVTVSGARAMFDLEDRRHYSILDSYSYYDQATHLSEDLFVYQPRLQFLIYEKNFGLLDDSDESLNQNRMFLNQLLSPSGVPLEGCRSTFHLALENALFYLYERDPNCL